MLIIIPVSVTDETLINDFSDCLNLFGPYPTHELLVVARPSDIIHGVTLLSKIKKSFKSADIHAFEKDGTRGWPQGPNFYWHSTICHLRDERKNKLPWLWMELDMTPLKHNWINILESEYKKAKKYCLGWTQDTTTLTSDGLVVPMTKHLVGAAVYPPDISVCCEMWQYVDRISTAFDVLCQWQLLPHSHHTELFQHCFRTQNYKKLEDGTIKGEDHNGFPGNLQFDFPINPKAVLHHGCDDGSLARLLVSNALSQQSHINKTKKVIKNKATTKKK